MIHSNYYRTGGNITASSGGSSGSMWNLGTTALTSILNLTTNDTQYVGMGSGTILQRQFSPVGAHGVIDISANDLYFRSFTIDGNVLSATGLLYSALVPDNSIPLQPLLYANSSVWIHAGCQRVCFEDVTFMHSGGYSVIIDGTTADTTDITFINCTFINCRPNFFGTSSGDLNYGAWNSGILYVNGVVGQSVTTNSCKNITLINCKFKNMAGTGFWGWSPDFTVLHENISVLGCSFINMALDGVQMTGLNVLVEDNKFFRTGYKTVSDAASPVPAYLAGYAPVAIDSTGYTQNFSYSNNVIYCPNGEGIDMDGCFDGVCCDNSISIPYPSDPLYTTEQVALFGYSGLGNISLGIQPGNTYYKLGGSNLLIDGNRIKNMGTRAISPVNLKNSIVSNNNITHLATATQIPIPIICVPGYDNGVYTDGNATTGTTADAPYYRSWGTQYINNRIDYDGANVCIGELDYPVAGHGTQTFNSGDAPNWVFNNYVLSASGPNYGEFFKNPNSSGWTGLQLSSNESTLGGNFSDTTRIVRYGQGTSGAGIGVTKIYSENSGVGRQLFSLTDAAFLNVSINGGANTGSLTTGNRSTTVLPDTVFTSTLQADGMILISSGTYSLANADLFPASVGVIWYDGTNLHFSSTVSGGIRQYQTFSFSTGSSGVTEILQGTGISVNTNTGNVTVTNTGVLSIGGYPGAFTFNNGSNMVLSGTTSITFSVSSNPSFNSVVSGTFNSTASGGSEAFETSTGSFYVTGAGALACQSVVTNLLSFGSVGVVVNSSGQFVSTGGVYTLFTGVACAGVNIYLSGQYYGAGTAGSPIQIKDVNGTTWNFRGGVICTY